MIIYSLIGAILTKLRNDKFRSITTTHACLVVPVIYESLVIMIHDIIFSICYAICIGSQHVMVCCLFIGISIMFAISQFVNCCWTLSCLIVMLETFQSCASES